MSQLNIALLGQMQVHVEGKPVTRFGFDRVRALLAYLSLEGHRPLDRNSLAFILWPDDPARRAMQNLRQALATLRKALGDNARSLPFIQTDSNSLQLNIQADILVDIVRFNQLIGQVKSHQHRHVLVCSGCLAKLEQAVNLYRDEFLDGLLIDSDMFEEWARERREEVHRQVANALALLTEARMRQGQFEPALRLAQRQLALDSLSTHGNHQLIHCLGAMGMRNEALRHYLHYQNLLQDELGLKPPQRTVALFLDLNEDDWHYRLLGERTPHNLPAEITPMIGYQAELAHIQERLAHKDCRLLTLAGPAGSGKTRLVTRVGWLELTNFQDGVFYVACHDDRPESIWQRLNQVVDVAQDQANPLPELLNWLRQREVLLILDGFEHQLDAAPELVRLLRASETTNVLVTSRIWLGLAGEEVVPLFGLPASAADCCPQTGQGESALTLFSEAVRRHLPGQGPATGLDHADCVQLCEAMGGLPAALELSAGWLRALSPREIHQRVGDNLRALQPPVTVYAQQHADLAS
ncbi:MAG: NACHT domain-containing protein, partial [Anaerolineales bacterium]|nr:NACHT domain-containing protein [Anaerolineales bacterium]